MLRPLLLLTNCIVARHEATQIYMHVTGQQNIASDLFLF